MARKIVGLGIGALLGAMALTGCSSDLSEEQVAEALKPMTVADESKIQEKPAQEFCSSMLTSYGKYGEAVTLRTQREAQGKGGEYTKDDFIANVLDQQSAVQEIEIVTGETKISDNSELEALRVAFREPSKNIIEAYNDAKETKDIGTLDKNITTWEDNVLPVVIKCANLVKK